MFRDAIEVVKRGEGYHKRGPNDEINHFHMGDPLVCSKSSPWKLKEVDSR